MPECFLYEAVLLFCNLAFQDGRHLPLLKIEPNIEMTKNRTEHGNDYLNNCLMDFDQICVKMVLALSCFKIK